MNELPVACTQRPMALKRLRDSALDLVQFLLLDAFPVVGTAAAVVAAGFLVLCEIR